jgi:hypothetical protein
MKLQKIIHLPLSLFSSALCSLFLAKAFQWTHTGKPGRAKKFAPVQDRTALQIRVCTSIGKIVCNKFSFFAKFLSKA